MVIIWSFGPRPQGFLACNAPIKRLYNLGVEIEENSVPADMYQKEIAGKYSYTIKDTFMGFHCGNTPSCKLCSHEMKYQLIRARSLPEEVTQGTLEGDIVPGEITFYRLQSTSDAKIRAYIAEGEVLPVRTRSFGSIGVFAIPEMGRFYRHVLIEKNYPHHGAVAFGHFGKTLYYPLGSLFFEEIYGTIDRNKILIITGGTKEC